MIINQNVSGGGTTPTGTKNITANGVYDVTDYASADVQVPTTAPTSYLEYGVYSGILQHSKTGPVMNFNGATKIAAYALAHAYEYNTNIVNLDMSSFTEINNISACESAFHKCTNLQTADLSSVTIISQDNAGYYMFYEDTSLQTVNLSSLKTLGGGGGFRFALAGCTSLTNANMSSLTTLGNSSGVMEGVFIGCTSLTSYVFESLKKLYGSDALKRAFANCTNLTSLSFPALNNTSFNSRTDQFTNMCQNIPNITLHFPSNIQSTIAGLSGYSTTAPFGAISGTILFDLPATNILTGANSVNYERNPKYDTATALSWRVENTDVDTTAYYTSGTTDPAVSDTIYSDAACTTAVTTISSIA